LSGEAGAGIGSRRLGAEELGLASNGVGRPWEKGEDVARGLERGRNEGDRRVWLNWRNLGGIRAVAGVKPK